jgi:lysine 6-dehydrogenase
MFNYCVIGSGKQGTASGYDLAKFGNASKIIMLDYSFEAAQTAANRINTLLNKNICVPEEVDITNEAKLTRILQDVDVMLSAVPYKFNIGLTKIAIKTNTSMVDLGGHTDNVREQLSKHNEAKFSGINIVPDCGMGPGMNITMALLAMEQLDEPEDVFIWDGGLPQNPSPPWNYNLFFHIDGLTNEYDGNAYFLRNNQLTEVPCFSDIETLDFKSIGKLEAAVTSGGLSTMPWTFENKLRTLENKTLRYQGHWSEMIAYRQLGLFSQEKVKLGNHEIIPREFYHTLLAPQLDNGPVKDVCIMRTDAHGKKNGKQTIAQVNSVEYFDENTQFSAMEKWTGWHASMVCIKIAEGNLKPGAISVENAITGSEFKVEGEKRGYTFDIIITES